MDTINLREKLNLINDLWKPRVIAELNRQQVKISKVKGEFVWHDHKNEDELFFIIKGTCEWNSVIERLKLMKVKWIVEPKGVEHRPIAVEEVWMMLFEPANIKHTGDVKSHLTINSYDKI